MSASTKHISAFRKAVWSYWKKEGRHDLPWRKTKDPYKILVSEVMLQQTQVPRVLEKYKEFLEAFPTVFVLSHASLRDVLRIWSGLGYNRRGKYLHDAAKLIANKYDGDFNEALRHPLPGVGPYTRAAVRVFAYNEPHSLLETNVRATFLHHFFADKNGVHDRDLVALMEAAAEGEDPREWHWALMDYGVHVKKRHKNPSRRSAGYIRQSKFEGSPRQLRGAILRELNASAKTESDLYLKVGKQKYLKMQDIKAALATLKKDGLVRFHAGKWRIA